MSNKITCEDLEKFCSVCAELTKHGIRFTADAGEFVIIITGF